jgi:putative transposase
VRRACTLFSVARSALDYQSRKAMRDSPVIERMKALAAQYPRFGYRRIGIFLGVGNRGRVDRGEKKD